MPTPEQDAIIQREIDGANNAARQLPLPEMATDWRQWANQLVVSLQDSPLVSGDIRGLLPLFNGDGNPVIDSNGGLWIWDPNGELPVAPDLFQIDTSQLVDAAITTAKLADLSVDVEKLADLAVSAAKLASGAVTSEKFADGSVTGDKLADLAVTASKLGDSSVTATKIDNLAVGSAAIANGAIISAKIANAAVGNAAIGVAAVGTAQIANAAITSALIGNAAVVTAKIDDLAVNNAKIANGAVTSLKIGDAAVTNAKIANLAVDTAQIANGAITSAQIANLAVTDAKIANATITDAKIANLNAAKITAGVLDVDRIGFDDLTITKDGNDLILKDGGVTTGKLANSAVTDVYTNSVGPEATYTTTGKRNRVSINIGSALAANEKLLIMVNMNLRNYDGIGNVFVQVSDGSTEKDLGFHSHDDLGVGGRFTEFFAASVYDTTGDGPTFTITVDITFLDTGASVGIGPTNVIAWRTKK